MRGLPYCHALAVIGKANLWVYDYVRPICKTATQEVIYNQLVHPMETHDMGIIGLVVSGKELDEDYNQCMLTPNNGRHLGRPPSKQRESQTQDKKVQRWWWSAQYRYVIRNYKTPVVSAFQNRNADLHCFRTQSPSHQLQNENACPFLNMIDPDYPKKANDVIDELAEEVRQVRDMIRVE
ncbi:hypothetical protein Cgig2_016509 [Carnegiea gigantea]|uniref:Uncharacterized protein n=1 Tax=Carnegiea gigantea TaxID=171969 RepID=A0A9Q1GGF5_9CARY|nr:hypothetical protein Cgig2_016509 [Carnegiea gigantea]